MAKNCSILSQKVPKFELYKHNDELFNIYYGIFFYELWTFAYFDRLCKLEKRGMKFKKNLLLWNYWANLNQTLLKWSLGGSFKKKPISTKLCWNDPWVVPFQNCVRQSKMTAITKIEISSNGRQPESARELYHNDGRHILLNFELLPILTDYAN